MTNNPACFIFFAGYLSHYVFFLCLLSKIYFSVFLAFRSCASAKSEILLSIYHLSRSLDDHFSDLFELIFLINAFFVFRILSLFSYSFISVYVIKHISSWLKPGDVLLFLSFYSLLVL